MCHFSFGCSNSKNILMYVQKYITHEQKIISFYDDTLLFFIPFIPLKIKAVLSTNKDKLILNLMGNK